MCSRFAFTTVRAIRQHQVEPTIVVDVQSSHIAHAVNAHPGLTFRSRIPKPPLSEVFKESAASVTWLLYMVGNDQIEVLILVQVDEQRSRAAGILVAKLDCYVVDWLESADAV